MQNFFLPPARPSTLSRSNSCLPLARRFSPPPSPADSQCALAVPDTTTRYDNLGLLHPPLQLVLLSNDSRFASLTRSFLQHAGFAVFTCTTSDRAESLFLSRSDLQLWIIDVQALGIEALYFATRVREQHPSMPILLILGEHHESHVLRQFLLHGWTQLTKPVDLAKMLETISNALTKVPRSSAAKYSRSNLPDARLEPFESDWLKQFRSTNLNRMRN
jgi:two-component system, chemotaxis family, chemotaxis protein CheY